MGNIETYRIIDIFLCVHCFSVRFKNSDRIIALFLCVLSRTEKSYNYPVGFRIFLSGYFGTDVSKKRTEKFVTHRNIRVSGSV